MTEATDPLDGRLIFSPAETQHILSMSHAHFYRQVKSGALRVFKDGRKTRIHRDDIKQWIANRMAEAGLTGQDNAA